MALCCWDGRTGILSQHLLGTENEANLCKAEEELFLASNSL